MNKRHREIIIYIKDCQKYNRKCTLRKLIDHFHVSERTIRYDLDEILRFFGKKHLPSLRMDDEGNIILLASDEDIQKVLQSNDFYAFKLNKKERAQMILYFLVEATDCMTLQELADILLVSRSTVIHDVNAARKIARNYNLEIVSVSKGLRIVGKESDCRILLMNIINEMDSLDYYYGQISNTDTYIFSQIIQENETTYEMFLTDQSFSELLTYLQIMINEINNGRYVEIDYVLQHPSTALIAGSILDAIMHNFGIQVSLPERYLLSDLLYNFKYIKRTDADDRLMQIQIIAKEFIDHLNQDIHVNIKNDFRFYQSLVNHLQSTFQDIQMSTDIDNHLLRKVIENNPETVQAIKRNIEPLEKVAGRTISKEEIAYITIHVQAAIERSKDYKDSISVLLVSNTGLGEVTLMVSKLKKFFNFNIVEVIPQHVLENYDLTGVDLILTTVPIQENRCESILVSPDLNDEECIILGEKVEKAKAKKTDSEIDQKFRKLEIQIAKEISESPLDKEIIYKNIITILRKHIYPESQNIKNILSYLLKDHISVDVEAKDWKEAISKSAKGLLEERYINELYIEEMIENVEKNGPYIVLAEGVAVPHASPYMGGFQLGMYLIRLKKPVLFGKDKEVRYVFCLSTFDKDSHLKPMFHLMNLLSNPEFIQSLDKCQTSENMYTVISNYEEML